MRNYISFNNNDLLKRSRELIISFNVITKPMYIILIGYSIYYYSIPIYSLPNLINLIYLLKQEKNVENA